MNDLERNLSAEAVRLDHLPLVDASLLFPYVLSHPVICSCRTLWAILLDQPLVLEYELGLRGVEHSSLLHLAMSADCRIGHSFVFYKTDGLTVWPEPYVFA